MDYITCERRKNAPQINVLICEKKCKFLNQCSAYQGYAKTKSRCAVLNSSAMSSEAMMVMPEAPCSNLTSLVGK